MTRPLRTKILSSYLAVSAPWALLAVIQPSGTAHWLGLLVAGGITAAVARAALQEGERLLAVARPVVARPAEPKVAEPAAVEPKAIEPETSEPEAVEPQSAEPEAAELEAIEPETSEPAPVLAEPTHLERVIPAAEPEAAAAQDLNRESLVTLIGSVVQGLEAITREAGALAQAGASQAASAEETATSMGQLAESFRQVDGNASWLAAGVEGVGEAAGGLSKSLEENRSLAENLREIAQQAAQQTNQGDEAVRRVQDGLTAIAEAVDNIDSATQDLASRSAQISSILEVIEEIADQTNLLALNAAIEAARAGEAGRGFSVVADEVRKLAKHSRGATQDIDKLIKGIHQGSSLVEKSTHGARQAVGEGQAMAAAAAAALQHMRQATDKTTQVANKVSKHVRAQAEIAEEMVGGVQAMGGMTQQVARATSEQQRASAQVVEAMAEISRAAHDSQLATERIAGVTRELRSEAAHILASLEGREALPAEVAEAP